MSDAVAAAAGQTTATDEVGLRPNFRRAFIRTAHRGPHIAARYVHTFESRYGAGAPGYFGPNITCADYGATFGARVAASASAGGRAGHRGGPGGGGG